MDKKMTRAARRRKQRNRRILLTVTLMMLVAVVSIGGTVAWLTDKTNEIKNTFTVGDINITLVETFNKDTDGVDGNDAWENKMIPGESYLKDPVVTVKANSEKCYLFVRFTESEKASTYLVYTSTLTSANGWTKLETEDDVWYRVVDNSDSDQYWNLLEDNVVTVNSTAVTKANMTEAAASTLTYKAWAIQFDGGENDFTAAEAWANIPTGDK